MNSKIKGLIKALFVRYPNARLNGPYIIADVTRVLNPTPQDYQATSVLVAITLEAMRKKGVPIGYRQPKYKSGGDMSLREEHIRYTHPGVPPPVVE